MIAAISGTVLLAGVLWCTTLIVLRTRREHMLVRVLLASVPLGAGMAMLYIASIVAVAPQHDWNSAKLAPIVAMVRGNPVNYRLYQEPLTGVMTAWIYGPVPALLFLPAAMFSRPTSEILAATLINMLMLLGPTVWLFFRQSNGAVGGRGRAGHAFAWLMFALFLWIVLAHESMRRAVLMISPDGPTLGFAICAIAILLGKRRGPLQMSLCALCATLACWSKQSAIPFLIIPPLFILLFDGALAAISYVLIQTIVSVVVSGLLLISFGPRNMWFHMVLISSTHGWNNEERFSHLALFLRGVQTFIEEHLWTIALIVMAILMRRVLVKPDDAPAAHREDWRQRFVRYARDNPWLILPAAGIVLAPASLAGYLKVGGYVNNFSLTHAFIALTACAMFIRLHADVRAQEQPPEGLAISPRSLVSAAVALALLTYWPEILLTRNISGMFESLKTVRDNQQEIVYDALEAHPGEVYFPWNPLSALLAEGKLYHFEWGAFDRYASKDRDRVPMPTPEQVIAHLPKKQPPRLIAFGPLHQKEFTIHGFLLPLKPGEKEPKALQWFPQLNQPIALKELPGFTVYTARR